MRIGTEPLDLRLTLVDSAQCFRWKPSGQRFGAVLWDRPVWLWRTPEGIEAEGDCDPAALRQVRADETEGDAWAAAMGATAK